MRPRASGDTQVSGEASSRPQGTNTRPSRSASRTRMGAPSQLFPGTCEAPLGVVMEVTPGAWIGADHVYPHACPRKPGAGALKLLGSHSLRGGGRQPGLGGSKSKCHDIPSLDLFRRCSGVRSRRCRGVKQASCSSNWIVPQLLSL